MSSRSLFTEHSITLNLELPVKDVHKQMEVFYNPVMASNRNIAILLLNSLPHQKMNLADPLAASGIRSLRFLKELKKEKINHLWVNDVKGNFVRVFKENAKKNNIFMRPITIGNEDASLFLLNRVNDRQKPKDSCGYFDYIEIDPFGSPNSYLDAAIARIAGDGIIAVTATDTAALSGTYEKVTRRKYWARPLRNYLMHELGIRILIRKIQLQAVAFDKALIPLLSYSKDHYYRLYLQSQKGKNRCDEVLRKHQYFLFCHACLNFKTSRFNREGCRCGREFDFAGPLWIGSLGDKKLLATMANNNRKNNLFPEEQKLMDLLAAEAKIDQVGFYDLQVLARKYKCDAPKIEGVLRKVKGVRTHFSGTGVKTERSKEDLRKVMNH